MQKVYEWMFIAGMGAVLVTAAILVLWLAITLIAGHAESVNTSPVPYGG